MSNSSVYSIKIRPVKGAFYYLYSHILTGYEKGFSDFELELENPHSSFYPNTLLPIAGILSSFGHNCQFKFKHDNQDFGFNAYSYAERAGIFNPYTDPEKVRSDAFLDKVWLFDADTHYDIVTGVVNSLRQRIVLAPGLLNALELCLNEISDNVLVHSSRNESYIPSGFIMAQVHQKTKKIAISVFDNGIGIQESLSRGGRMTNTVEEAISLAFEKGVTDGKGAGNGLWLLQEVVKQGLGSISVVTSGTSFDVIHKEGVECAPLTREYMSASGTTLVDFQLFPSSVINLNAIMGDASPVDYWTENHESDDTGQSIQLNVRTEAHGLGSRFDAKLFRTVVENILTDQDITVVLDFNDVEIVSLSFADELINKLKKRIGVDQFNSRVRLVNLSSGCRSIFSGIIENY